MDTAEGIHFPEKVDSSQEFEENIDEDGNGGPSMSAGSAGSASLETAPAEGIHFPEKGDSSQEFENIYEDRDGSHSPLGAFVYDGGYSSSVETVQEKGIHYSEKGDSSREFEKGRDISVEEFKKSELLSFYNHLTDADLLVISNRNLHLMAIHQEFLKFSMFINRPLNKKHFDVFLIPVFQHLYLLIRSHCGESDALRFTRYYSHLPIPKSVIDSLLQCKTCGELQSLILSSPRIRVKLSSEAYHILMNWFRDCFSKSVDMFNILRVLHENFHVDIYQDKDDEEFAAVEMEVLRSIKEWMDRYEAQKKQKKSGSKVSVETSKTPPSDEDDNVTQKKSGPKDSAETCKTKQNVGGILTEKMTELVIDPEPKTPKTCELEIDPTPETPKMPETPLTSESNDSESSEIKSSMFKLRPAAKKVLEKARRLGWDLDKTEEALLNLNIHDSSEKDDEERDLEDPVPKAKEEMGLEEDLVPKAPENADLSPLEPTVSPGDSEYVILSEASTERNDEEDTEVQENIADQDMKDENMGDSVQVQENLESKDQDMADENMEESIQVQENLESKDQAMADENIEKSIQVQENLELKDQAMADVTTKGVKKGDKQRQRRAMEQSRAKHYFHEFKQSYKTNFHSAYPLTISGKDVLCSSDVSSDFLYLACGFESCKICTWRLCCEVLSVRCTNDFKLQPLGTLKGHKGIVYALSIDSRMKTLISGSHDKTVRIWDLEKSECLSEIQAHSAPVYTVCASPNSSYFLSASEDKDVVLFWYDDLYPVRVYSGHSMEAINCVKFHPNCTYFASASNDGNLFLFKINDDRCPVRMFRKHIAKVYTLAFSPCGKYLASADVDGLLITWNILAHAPVAIYETGQGIRSISYDTSGSFIAAVFFYKSWKVYNVEEDNISPVIEAESAGVPKSVHFSKDNKMLIVQYIEADKSEIAKTKEKPKTEIKKVN